jgi:glycosyltransferase involved in cell wall biosynthesis
LAGDPDLRRQLGDLNRKRVEERYSFEALCSAYRELYESVLVA